MRLAAGAILSLLIAPVADAQERFAERTPLPLNPAVHTPDRAGNAHTIAPWAISGVTRFEAGGYVGGGSLRGNSILAKGSSTAPGPVTTGTFGWDYAGPCVRPGRVFLAPSPDPSAGSIIARNYRTDGPRILDVFNLRPFRRAVLQKREVLEERKGEGH